MSNIKNIMNIDILEETQSLENEEWSVYRTTGDPEKLKEVSKLVEKRYKTVEKLSNTKSLAKSNDGD